MAERLIGVDVGGTKVSVAVLDGTSLGDPVLHRTDTSSTDALLAQLEAVVREQGGCDAVGLGVPSVVDWATGSVRFSPNIPLVGFPLRTVLQERLGVPVFVDNDAAVAALAESYDDALQPIATSLVMVTVGTGVGGGIVLDGRVFRGVTGAAAELGHTVIAADVAGGAPPAAGYPHPASLEHHASGRALDRLAEERGLPTGPQLVARAQEGHDDAVDALRVIGERLGIGIANLMNLLDPELVVVGGGVSAAGELLLGPARASAARFVLTGVGTRTRIELARYGPTAGVRGAALLARTESAGSPALAPAVPDPRRITRMSTVNVNERLAKLTAAGTSIWLDEIRRGLISSGELERLVREDCLRGVTSNPAIFEKSILGSDDYDDQLAELTAEGLDKREIYQGIAIKDVQDACDVLRRVYDESEGLDGYVSLEVDPDLAHDPDKTIVQAREYWSRVDRPNLMIKIPGTAPGVPAIETAISEGINVNVTLLFAVEAYAKIAEAFVRGLEIRLDKGDDVTGVHSVASFFVSRVDTEVDKRLKGHDDEDELRGKAGLANARAAYQRYTEIFEGERFAKLREAGAPVQRPLWASTGVKDPSYSDTMYVDGLVAPNTVNTMPMATLRAAADHAEVTGATAAEDPAEVLAALEAAGIDMEDVTRHLLDDGIAKFVTPMEALLAGIEVKREQLVTGAPASVETVLPAELEQPIADAVARADEEEVARRLWKKDATLFAPEGTPEVANRMGWLTVTEVSRDALDDLTAFAAGVKDDGYTDVVLLGMGGSSLGPEVLRRSFGEQSSGLPLHVLDSTDAQAVRDVEARVGEKPFFVVSSKSGGTLETLSHFAYFHAKHPDGAGFTAVTDPASPLADLAAEHGFRRVWLNDPDIGGRYSVLSFFGMVPAALAGYDVAKLLDTADVARAGCGEDGTVSSSGLWLGVALGEMAKHGRDKLTLVVDEPLSSFGLWAEQLVAESLGKDGVGIVPIAGEPLGDVAAYGPDRVFVHLKVGGDDGHTDKLKDLSAAGHPVLTLNVDDDPAELGNVFFTAEFATAVAGWVLGINPFDQPNVQEAKDATQAVLDGGGDVGPSAVASTGQVLDELLHGGAPLYYALMGYLPPSDDVDRAVEDLRQALRARTTAATTWGYGPRFLHSTGQLHKGGAKLGRFLQLVQSSEDAEIPGKPFTFEALKRAQAMGDLATLQGKGLPAWQLTVTGDPAAFIADLATQVRGR